MNALEKKVKDALDKKPGLDAFDLSLLLDEPLMDVADAAESLVQKGIIKPCEDDD